MPADFLAVNARARPPLLPLPSVPLAGFVNFLRSRKRDFVSIHLAGNYRQRHMIRVPAYRSPRFMGNACKLREKRLLYLRALPSKAELDMAIVPRTIDTRHVFFLSIPSPPTSLPSDHVRAEGTETSTIRGKPSWSILPFHRPRFDLRWIEAIRAILVILHGGKILLPLRIKRKKSPCRIEIYRLLLEEFI